MRYLLLAVLLPLALLAACETHDSGDPLDEGRADASAIGATPAPEKENARGGSRSKKDKRDKKARGRETAPEGDETVQAPRDTAGAGPLYLSIVVHSEEDKGANQHPKRHVPDYDGNDAVFTHFASAMREFGELAARHGAKINFGMDWTFSDGVHNFDSSFYRDMEQLGHEVDAHAHESHVSVYEVQQRIERAGGKPSPVNSGLREDQVAEKMASLDAHYPSIRFLWGVASAGHGAGEVIAGWIWRPSRGDWMTHDPEGKYIYIGRGEGVNNVDSVATAVAARRPGCVNTYSMFTSVRDFKADEGSASVSSDWKVARKSRDHWENRLAWWDETFTSLEERFVSQGSVQFTTLSEAAQIFEQQEADLAFPDKSEIPRSDMPAVQRQRMSGY